MASAVLTLNNWNAVVPVLLPLGEHTISAIGVASVAITVPFFLYILAMFSLLLPIWMENHKSDNARISGSLQQDTEAFVAASLVSEGRLGAGMVGLSMNNGANNSLDAAMGYAPRGWGTLRGADAEMLQNIT